MSFKSCSQKNNKINFSINKVTAAASFFYLRIFGNIRQKQNADEASRPNHANELQWIAAKQIDNITANYG